MILVVDDNKTTQDILHNLLKSEGIDSDCCGSADAALKAAQDHSYRAFLIDYRMPGMTGEELTRLLRSAYPGSFIVGYSIESKDQAFLAAGADSFCIKYHLLQKIVPLIRSKIRQNNN